MVIHEYWGLNDWVKEQAAKLADRGYATLAIDLYRGKVATTPDEAHEIMGGGYSLKVALQEPTLGAAVINYGHLAAHADSLKKINAAVLGIFGGQDRGIPVDDVKQFEQTLKQQGNKVEIVISRRRTCLRESQQQDGLSRG